MTVHCPVILVTTIFPGTNLYTWYLLGKEAPALTTFLLASSTVNQMCTVSSECECKTQPRLQLEGRHNVFSHPFVTLK